MVSSRSKYEHELLALYEALLCSPLRFNEFKRLLQSYDWLPSPARAEPASAAAVRESLNTLIRTWIGDRAEGLSHAQVLEWKKVVAER
jgi:hypothetical protein